MIHGISSNTQSTIARVPKAYRVQETPSAQTHPLKTSLQSKTSTSEESPKLPAWQLASLAQRGLSICGEDCSVLDADTPNMSDYDTIRLGHPIHPSYQSVALQHNRVEVAGHVHKSSTEASQEYAETANERKCGACRRLKKRVHCAGGYPCVPCQRRGRDERACRSAATFAEQHRLRKSDEQRNGTMVD